MWTLNTIQHINLSSMFIFLVFVENPLFSASSQIKILNDVAANETCVPQINFVRVLRRHIWVNRILKYLRGHGLWVKSNFRMYNWGFYKNKNIKLCFQGAHLVKFIDLGGTFYPKSAKSRHLPDFWQKCICYQSNVPPRTAMCPLPW